MSNTASPPEACCGDSGPGNDCNRYQAGLVETRTHCDFCKTALPPRPAEHMSYMRCYQWHCPKCDAEYCVECGSACDENGECIRERNL